MLDRASTASRQWRRERPDLDPLPMEILGRLRELAHRAERDTIAPLFARFGLQSGEFDVLATLCRTGAPYSLTPTELYETLMISSGGMTNRLDRLEKAGLIKRCPHPHDRRGTLVALSVPGKALIDGMLEAHVANCNGILSPLTTPEQETLNTLLAKLVAGLGQETASS